MLPSMAEVLAVVSMTKAVKVVEKTRWPIQRRAQRGYGIYNRAERTGSMRELNQK
jgi:hypothetical protein